MDSKCELCKHFHLFVTASLSRFFSWIKMFYRLYLTIVDVFDSSDLQWVLISVFKWMPETCVIS